jgi:uncharacterized OsmC-like protein
MSQQNLTYRVEARRVEPGVSTTTIKETEIVLDTSDGQSAVLPGPADLLTLAFSACVLKNVERFSHLLPFRYQGARIEVTAERQASPPRMTSISYRLYLQTDESAQRVDLLHRNIKKFGTIYNTLTASCVVEGEIVVEPPKVVQPWALGDVASART